MFTLFPVSYTHLDVYKRQVMTYLRPDSKSQVTIEYDETTNKPLRVHTIVVSTQHDDYELAIWTLRRLLKQKVEVNARDAMGRTALMHLLGPVSYTHPISENGSC